MSRGRKTKKQKLTEIKKELVENLDDFLLDENSPVKVIDRSVALAALDKLIKQDLVSENAILKFQQSKTKQEALLKKVSQVAQVKSEVVKLPASKALSSANVLDLRQVLAEKQATKKQLRVRDGWQSFQAKLKDKLIFSRENKEVEEAEEFVYHQPAKEKIKWQLPNFSLPKFSLPINGLVGKLTAFALIIFVLLLPIRGLVLFGKIKNDKDKIWGLSQSGLVNLKSGALSAAENSYDQASADFQQALSNFSDIQQVLNEYQQWQITSGELLPIVGKPLAVSKNLLSVGQNISQAAVILNQKLQDQASLTEHITFIQEQIDETLPYLTEAAKNIEGINVNNLPEQVQGYFGSLKSYLPDIVTSLDNLDEIFSVLLEVLGGDEEKRYLVLFQNNNELRATGGFIGSFALIDIYQGEIKNLEIPKGGTYDLTAGQTVKLKSPQALSLINPYFNIWDANWWPDFPTSAKKVEWFFTNFGGSSVDGVISVNANVLQDLLVVTGPIYLPEYDLTISSSNVFSVLQDEVELNYDKESNQPKAIIADLAPILLHTILSQTAKQKEIVSVLTQELASKDIQLYLNNPEIQAKVYAYGWSGSTLATGKDYLQVVSTNIGGGKTDNDVYQTIDHQAEITNTGEIINTVRVTRVNRGSENNLLAGIDGGNVSYLRFYVPQGSEFISAQGFDHWPANYFNNVEVGTQVDQDVAKEEDKFIDNTSQMEIYESLNKAVFANWVALKPGETQTVSIKYKLPFKIKIANPTVNNWWQKMLTGNVQLDNYSLLVQNQSGDRNTVFNSSVLLPSNLKVVWNKSSAQEQMSVNDKLVTFTDQLLTDQYFGFIVTVK